MYIKHFCVDFKVHFDFGSGLLFSFSYSSYYVKGSDYNFIFDVGGGRFLQYF